MNRPQEPATSYITIEPAWIKISSMRNALIAVLISLLASCASSGLYNMSDTWCAAHPGASMARCPKQDGERRVAANDREHEHDADSEAETSY